MGVSPMAWAMLSNVLLRGIIHLLRRTGIDYPKRVSAPWIINICRNWSKAAMVGVDGEFRTENEEIAMCRPAL
jgi:hypothetical protein